MKKFWFMMLAFVLVWCGVSSYREDVTFFFENKTPASIYSPIPTKSGWYKVVDNKWVESTVENYDNVVYSVVNECDIKPHPCLCLMPTEPGWYKLSNNEWVNYNPDVIRHNPKHSFAAVSDIDSDAGPGKVLMVKPNEKNLKKEINKQVQEKVILLETVLKINDLPFQKKLTFSDYVQITIWVLLAAGFGLWWVIIPCALGWMGIFQYLKERRSI